MAADPAPASDRRGPAGDRPAGRGSTPWAQTRGAEKAETRCHARCLRAHRSTAPARGAHEEAESHAPRSHASPAPPRTEWNQVTSKSSEPLASPGAGLLGVLQIQLNFIYLTFIFPPSFSNHPVPRQSLRAGAAVLESGEQAGTSVLSRTPRRQRLQHGASLPPTAQPEGCPGITAGQPWVAGHVYDPHPHPPRGSAPSIFWERLTRSALQAAATSSFIPKAGVRLSQETQQGAICQPCQTIPGHQHRGFHQC
nr:uncharacterized protein LOC120368432 [Saimiri boliviensis boliviensis]